MSPYLRISLAFVIAPLIGCIIVLPLFSLALDRPFHWWRATQLLRPAVIVAEVVTLVLAVPTYLVLRRYKRVALSHCLIAGSVIGLCGSIVGVLIGCFAGWAFWLIGIRKSTPLTTKSQMA